MLIDFLQTLNQQLEVIEPDQEAIQFYDEDLFHDIANSNFNTAKKALTAIIRNFKGDRNITAMAIFHMGLIYDSRQEHEAAKRYFRHIVVNYQDQEKIYQQSKVKLMPFQKLK